MPSIHIASQTGSTDETRLDRRKWHSPLISVIITHRNYADHVEQALLSILDQTHKNWECIIVDDASSREHLSKLKEILARTASPKIWLIESRENIGQINSFYLGLDNSTGDFAALLDPDDRYAESFLEAAIDAHLDDTFFCPVVCTDQHTLTARGITTGTHMWYRRNQREDKNNPHGIAKDPSTVTIERLFFPPWLTGTFWSSTSGLVFRRSALKYLRPHRQLSYLRAADAYLASGAHIMGGTLFVLKPLVYRGLHERNSWITEDLFSMHQSKQRPGAPQMTPVCRRDAVEALLHNGGRNLFDDAFLSWMLKTHFNEDDLTLLRAASPHVAELAPAPTVVPQYAPVPTKRKSLISRTWKKLRKATFGS